jgi:uncharacterized protein
MMPSLFKSLQLFIAASLCFFLGVPAGFALSPQDLPAQPPEKAVLDSADVLSRAGKNEIEARLNQLESSKVDARVITLRKLDYGLSLTGFGEELVERWSNNDNSSERPLILFLEETQNKQAAVVVSAELSDQLPDALRWFSMAVKIPALRFKLNAPPFPQTFPRSRKRAKATLSPG